MAINSPSPDVPEAHITRPDESKASSNGGLNIALVLTLVLSVACIVWAAFAVPHWNFNGDMTRPENQRQNSNLPDPNSLAPGTTGAVMPNKGNEHSEPGNKSYLNGQEVQGDTITRGPGSPPADPEKLSKRSQEELTGSDALNAPNNTNQNQ